MGKAQKITIVTALAIALLMCVFPPWERVYFAWPQVRRWETPPGSPYWVAASYGFVFVPPGHSRLDIARLTVQLFLLAITTASVFFIPPMIRRQKQ